jgi:hypothetical protein
MIEIIKIPAQAKEIVKNKRTGQVYADKSEITVASVTTKPVANK